MQPSPSFEPRRTRVAQAAALAAALLGGASGGCASVPKGAAAVDTVNVEGNDKVSSGDIEDKIATAASPKFLMLIRGVIYDYELFDRFVLQRDLARVERYYRARGFYQAHARAGRVEYKNDNHVRVTIEVEEGPPVLVKEVVLNGTDGLPPDVVAAAQGAAHGILKPSKIFDEDDFTKTDDDIKRALTDRGFAYAQTSRRAEVDLPAHTARVVYEVFPGPPSVFGPVKIEGLGNLPEGPVRRALDLHEGERYSTQAIDDAKQAVLDLGAFGNVTIDPELPDPPPPNAVVPLTVRVERSKLHEVTLGGGVEFDPIKTDLHLITGWEDRNFFGGFRHLTTQLRPGVVLYPTRFQTPMKAPTDYLLEEKFRAELRQPGFLEARTNGRLTGEVNTYPLILTPQQTQRPVLGYFEAKGLAGVDRTWWKLYASPSYNIQTDTPFAYLGERAPYLSTVVASYIDLLAHLDFRDDRIHPHKGLFFQNDLQFAGLGGDARDLRDQPDARAYVPVAKKVTWATRASIGVLFPFNYEAPNPTQDLATNAKNTQLVFIRGFFSGGSTSNRGYPLRGIGPHGIIPFYNPGVANQQLQNECNPVNGQPLTPDQQARCQLPIGGFTLWEASTELRFPISGPLEAASFCDASDVEAGKWDFYGFGRLHLSCGVGARYDTPVGPIRLDLGVRIPHLQWLGHTDRELRQVEADPGTIFGLPVALAFGIGEPF